MGHLGEDRNKFDIIASIKHDSMALPNIAIALFYMLREFFINYLLNYMYCYLSTKLYSLIL